MSFYDEAYGFKLGLDLDDLQDIAADILEVYQEVNEQFRTLMEEAESLDDQPRISEILDCMNAEAQRKLVERIGPDGYEVDFVFEPGDSDDSDTNDDFFIFGDSYFHGEPSA